MKPSTVLLIALGSWGDWHLQSGLSMSHGRINQGSVAPLSAAPLPAQGALRSLRTLFGSGEDGLGMLSGRRCAQAVLGHSGHGPGSRGWTSDRCTVCTGPEELMLALSLGPCLVILASFSWVFCWPSSSPRTLPSSCFLFYSAPFPYTTSPCPWLQLPFLCQ